jgi:hypothetical protein
VILPARLPGSPCFKEIEAFSKRALARPGRWQYVFTLSRLRKARCQITADAFSSGNTNHQENEKPPNIPPFQGLHAD